MWFPRDDQNQDANGTILNMTLSGDVWNSIYSILVTLGKNRQQFYLSVDTGSSDIWIASRGCATSVCNGAHTSFYDPSDALQSGQTVSLNYLQGAATGLIVWDQFTIGPYNIPSQAFVAATDVTNEPLSPNFVGLFGLALPINSKVAQLIAPTVSDSPDGATFQQNLFGLTPTGTGPTHQFFGISLERWWSSRIPSLLAIGKHPENLIPGFNPSQAPLTHIISSRSGDRFWRVSVDSITGWVNGVPKPVALGKSEALTSTPSPVALLDTGGSVILATRNIANAIYGAWGIGPALDGYYYVPCKTPMNISIGLGGLPPIPLHPLDITAIPSGPSPSTAASTCQGVIQADDHLAGFGDMVLGVPFLRNVYTILSSNVTNNNNILSHQLGLVPLTDPTVAMQEFHNVRVLGLPLDSGPQNTTRNAPDVKVGKKLSIGIVILIAIVGFFALCALLFGVRYWLLRRKFKRGDAALNNSQWDDAREKRNSASELDGDTIHTRRWGKEGRLKSHYYSEDSSSSDRTRVDSSYISDDDVSPRSSTMRNNFRASAMTDHDIQHDEYFTPTHVRTTSQLQTPGGTIEPLLDHDDNDNNDNNNHRYSPWVNHLITPQPFEDFGNMAAAPRQSVASTAPRHSVASTNSMSGGGGKRRVPRSRTRLEEEGSSSSYFSTKTRARTEAGDGFDLYEVLVKNTEDVATKPLEQADVPSPERQQ